MSDVKRCPCDWCNYEKGGSCDAGMCLRYATYYSDKWARTVALFKPKPRPKKAVWQYYHPDEVRAKR